MSAPALTRKVQVRTLEKERELPCDGRIYRESDGKPSFGIRYPSEQLPRHRWLLSRIQAADQGRGQ